MIDQILLKCKYDHGMEQAVTRICLAMGCNQERRICDICLKTENHKYHLKDCVPLAYLELITKKELKKLQGFRNTLQQQFPHMNDDFQTYENEIEMVLNKLHNLDLSDFCTVIGSAVRYYNSVIQEELKHIIFQFEQSDQRKKILQILDQQYSFDDERFMITSFISRGDDLSQSENYQLALNYYNMALELNVNKELRFFVLTKKYNLLLSFGRTKEASSILKILLETPVSGLHHFVFNKIKQGVDYFKNKPQFDLMKDIVFRAYQHSTNENIIEAMALFKFKQFKQAIKALRRITQTEPCYTLSLELTGKNQKQLVICLINQDKISEALKFINYQLEIYPNQETFIVAKDACLKIYYSYFLIFLLGEQEEENKTNVKSPLLFLKLIKKSLTKARIENNSEALKHLETANEICPNNLMTNYLKGILLLHSNEKVQANLVFANLKIHSINFDNQKLLQSSLLRIKGEYQECSKTLTLCEHYLNSSFAPGNFSKIIKLEKWALLFEKNQFIEALNTLDLLLLHFPHNQHILALKSLTLFEINNFTEAEHNINMALLIKSPYDTDYFYLQFLKGLMPSNLGFILVKMRNFSEAEKCFETVVNQKNKFSKANSCICIALKQIAIILMMQGFYSKAIPYLEKCSLQDPKNNSYIYNKVIALSYIGRYNEALQEFQKLNFYCNSNIYTAIALLNLNQYDQAQKFLQNISNSDQNKTKKIVTLLKGWKFKQIAISLIGLNQYNSALKLIDEEIGYRQICLKSQMCQGIDCPRFFAKINIIYFLKKFDEAELIIDSLLYHSSEQILTLQLFKAGLLIHQELNQEAQQFLNQILLQNRNSCSDVIVKASNLLGKYNNQQAKQLFNQEFEQDPNHVMIKQLIKDTETLQLIDHDLQWKKSQFNLWLFNVDSSQFTSDLWTLFDFDIKE